MASTRRAIRFSTCSSSAGRSGCAMSSSIAFRNRSSPAISPLVTAVRSGATDVGHRTSTISLNLVCGMVMASEPDKSGATMSVPLPSGRITILSFATFCPDERNLSLALRGKTTPTVPLGGSRYIVKALLKRSAKNSACAVLRTAMSHRNVPVPSCRISCVTPSARIVSSFSSTELKTMVSRGGRSDAKA